jgi:hypothetical protein
MDSTLASLPMFLPPPIPCSEVEPDQVVSCRGLVRCIDKIYYDNAYAAMLTFPELQSYMVFFYVNMACDHIIVSKIKLYRYKGVIWICIIQNDKVITQCPYQPYTPFDAETQMKNWCGRECPHVDETAIQAKIDQEIKCLLENRAFRNFIKSGVPHVKT